MLNKAINSCRYNLINMKNVEIILPPSGHVEFFFIVSRCSVCDWINLRVIGSWPKTPGGSFSPSFRILLWLEVKEVDTVQGRTPVSQRDRFLVISATCLSVCNRLQLSTPRFILDSTRTRHIVILAWPLLRG